MPTSARCSYGNEARHRERLRPPRCANADVKMYEYIWRVGLNYRFDWATFGKGKGPVMAKY